MSYDITYPSILSIHRSSIIRPSTIRRFFIYLSTIHSYLHNLIFLFLFLNTSISFHSNTHQDSDKAEVETVVTAALLLGAAVQGESRSTYISLIKSMPQLIQAGLAAVVKNVGGVITIMIF